jgi:hypothetical protein
MNASPYLGSGQIAHGHLLADIFKRTDAKLLDAAVNLQCLEEVWVWSEKEWLRVR